MNQTRQHAKKGEFQAHNAPGRVDDMLCPDCWSPMRLRDTRFGLMYGCSRYPDCRSTHGAHPDGTPLGTPADHKTKAWRIVAHALFDRLWKEGPMNRGQAYGWLKNVAGKGDGEAHIGGMSALECEVVIRNLILREKRQRVRELRRDGEPQFTHEGLEQFLRG